LASYYNEHEDAGERKRLIEEFGRKCVLAAGEQAIAARSWS
jgi:hypothetical protein